MGFSDRKRSPMSLLSSALIWVLSVFLLLVAIVFFPSLTSLLLLLCVALIIPIQKWQGFLRQFTPNRWIKTIAAVLLVFMAITFTPTTPVSQPDPDSPTITASQITSAPEGSSPPGAIKPTTLPEAPTPTCESISPTPSSPAAVAPPEDSFFEIHFIDVGQADAALVLCDGHSMLIDGGNADDSSLIYAYLKNNKVSTLDYIVCSHAHEDHVGGLSGALNYATVGTAYEMK